MIWHCISNRDIWKESPFLQHGQLYNIQGRPSVHIHHTLPNLSMKLYRHWQTWHRSFCIHNILFPFLLFVTLFHHHYNQMSYQTKEDLCGMYQVGDYCLLDFYWRLTSISLDTETWLAYHDKQVMLVNCEHLVTPLYMGPKNIKRHWSGTDTIVWHMLS